MSSIVVLRLRGCVEALEALAAFNEKEEDEVDEEDEEDEEEEGVFTEALRFESAALLVDELFFRPGPSIGEAPDQDEVEAPLGSANVSVSKGVDPRAGVEEDDDAGEFDDDDEDIDEKEEDDEEEEEEEDEDDDEDEDDAADDKVGIE